MGQKEIEKKLKQYAAVSEKIVPENRECRIRELLQTSVEDSDMSGLVRIRGTLWNFVWDQIGYLGRYCLIWQALWILVFWYMMRYGVSDFWGRDSGNGILVTVSILTPLLVLLTVEQVTKVYQRSMLEIEYATKYSLRSVVMIRMLALCVVHSMILVICILCLYSRTEAEPEQLLVYGFTPMIVVTAILFGLMQHFQGETLRSAAVGLYALMTGLMAIGNTEYLEWYQPVYFRVWCMVCGIGIVSGACQLVYLNRKLSSYESIV